MAATKYTFSVAGDFPNGKVATDALTQEIDNSMITKALDRIDTSDGICDVWFKDVLSSGEEVYLVNIVGTHQGVALQTYDQIGRASCRERV